MYLIGLRPNFGPRTFEISESLHTTLSTLAKHEGRPEHDLLPDLLAAGLTQYYSTDELWTKWESLSPRERDVTALTCLGYTNRQIAFRFGISTETVKTHIHNVLVKFQMHSKSELRLVMSEWDFGAWAGKR
jgi:DNA-binding CsgD family transcriptional regulator